MAKSPLLKYQNKIPKEVLESREKDLIKKPEQQEPKKDSFYLILGFMKYEEDGEEEKVWEILQGKKPLYEWLKESYEWLDLDRTAVRQATKDLIVSLKDDGATAYECLKILQEEFDDEEFDIDEMIENNIY